jgi:hypothetical protein
MAPGELRRLRAGEALSAVVRSILTARFGARARSQLAAGELSPYVEFLIGQPDPSRKIVGLTAVYGRLTDPAKAVARAELVHPLLDVDPRHGIPATPEARAAWASWYREFASTLDASSLNEAASNVFPLPSVTRGAPPPSELPTLPAFEHAWSLLTNQAHGRESAESAMLACRVASRCSSALFKYFSLREDGSRRERLARALLDARDPVLTQFVLVRFFQQGDGHHFRDEVLSPFLHDAAAWRVALASAMVADASPEGLELIEIWRHRPDLRAPLLSAAADAGANAAVVLPDIQQDAVRHVRDALNEMARRFCHGPERADFIAQFRAHVPQGNPVSIVHRSSACDEAD